MTNNLTTTQNVYNEYQKHKGNELYKSVMDIIVKANKELFQEESKMCQALFELFEDQLMAMAEEKAMAMAEEKAMAKAMEKAEKIALEKAELKAQELTQIKMKEKQQIIINNLINNAHFSLEQALDILMISGEERKLYTFA